uniref:Uncharacterized protein n=1 Tax=Octopus bimaculoides TaxID=37653 RepID=A0A0L8HQL8_OCTBM
MNFNITQKKLKFEMFNNMRQMGRMKSHFGLVLLMLLVWIDTRKHYLDVHIYMFMFTAIYMFMFTAIYKHVYILLLFLMLVFFSFLHYQLCVTHTLLFL